VVTARYANGAIGVAEASFVTTPGASAFEIRGTEASLLHGFGRDGLIAKGGRFGDEWAAVALEPAGRAPFDLWIDAIRDDADITSHQRAAVDLTRFIIAANIAAATGQTVTIDHEGLA